MVPVNREPHWEPRPGSSIARAPSSGIIRDMGPSLGLGDWHQPDGEQGTGAAQAPAPAPAVGYRELGAATGTSITLALGTRTRSQWLCLGHCTRMGMGQSGIWACQGHWAVGVHEDITHGGCRGEASGPAGLGCKRGIPQSGCGTGPQGLKELHFPAQDQSYPPFKEGN